MHSDLPMCTDEASPVVKVEAKLLLMLIWAEAAAGASSAATRASRATRAEIANGGPAVNRPLARAPPRVAAAAGQSVRARLHRTDKLASPSVFQAERRLVVPLQQLGDLHRVGGGALAQVVGDDEQ